MARPVSLDDLYSRPGFLLRRAHQIAVGIFAEECERFGLTPPQHSVLIILDHCPGMDQASLARSIGIDRATIGQVLRGLERRRLVTRIDSLLDRRSKTLSLTPEGRTLIRQAGRAIKRTSDRLLSPLKSKDRQRLVDLLLRLTNELNESSRHPLVR